MGGSKHTQPDAGLTSFRHLMEDLRDAHKIRETSRETEALKIPNPRSKSGYGYGHSHLNRIANGHERPTMPVIAAVCKARDLDPDAMVEYRLAKARNLFDEEVVGFDQALANLLANRPEPAADVLATALGDAAGLGVPEPERPAKRVPRAHGRRSEGSAS